MALDPISGAISWTPSAVQASHYDFNLQLDYGCQTMGRLFSQHVAERLNAPPEDHSPEPSRWIACETSDFQLSFQDPDGDALHFSILEAPLGRSFPRLSLCESIPHGRSQLDACARGPNNFRREHQQDQQNTRRRPDPLHLACCGNFQPRNQSL